MTGSVCSEAASLGCCVESTLLMVAVCLTVCDGLCLQRGSVTGLLCGEYALDGRCVSHCV